MNSTPETADRITQLLEPLADPYTGQTLGEGQAVDSVRVDVNRAEIEIRLGYPCGRYAERLAAEVRSALAPLDGIDEVAVTVTPDIVVHAVQRGVKPLESIKNILAVASGKGGVGKSTVAVNVALALAAEGAQVGILDADIYGPSQPKMLGVSGKPEIDEKENMVPHRVYDVQTMSIGFMVDEETPMIWRGPMVSQALDQLLRQTSWGDLDYLIVDLPPGTGDIQLSLSQKVPVTGAIIVTTPQDIALLDARKAYKMFDKVEVPVLGVVENMSTHICSNCGHEEPIFGQGGGRHMAEQYGLPYLGGIPLHIDIREQTDAGRPPVVAEPDGELAKTYTDIALSAAGRLATRKRDYSRRFGSIVVEGG